MPTEKRILNFPVDEALYERLEDFRFSNRIGSRAEAIRQLLDEALRNHENPAKVKHKALG
jgi:metal-responsive CopG/Arc/MetJ family transcriptional regulator